MLIPFFYQIIHTNKNIFVNCSFLIIFTASAHTGELGVDEYPDISGITNARVLKKN